MHCQMQASSFPDLPESWISWVCLVLQSMPTGHPVLGPPSSSHTGKREHVILSCGWKESLYLWSCTKIWFPHGVMLWLCLCQLTFLAMFPFHGQVLLASESIWALGGPGLPPAPGTGGLLPGTPEMSQTDTSLASALVPSPACWHPHVQTSSDRTLVFLSPLEIMCFAPKGNSLWRVPVFLWSGFPRNVGGRGEVFAAGECLTISRLRGAGCLGTPRGTSAP